MERIREWRDHSPFLSLNIHRNVWCVLGCQQPSTALCHKPGVEEGSGGGWVCFSSFCATVRDGPWHTAVFLWCSSSRQHERSARTGRRQSIWVMVHEFHLSGHSPHLGQIQKNVRPLRVPGKSSKGQASKVHSTSEGWSVLKWQTGGRGQEDNLSVDLKLSREV